MLALPQSQGKVATQCLRAQWLLLRRLPTGDTLLTYANGSVAAQHLFDLLSLGVGVLNLLVGRADPEARAS